ncbi:MAG: hypothetical protein SGI92_10735, partial [Bryobacteraceae bacterium]|nr:hypothetical protein [Bryobacteraceae bacterium]
KTPEARASEPVAVDAVAPATAPAAPKLPAWKTPEYTEEKAAAPAGAALRAEDAEDPRVTKAREATLAYLGSLPNYYCKENIARYVSTSTPVSWRAVDLLSMALVYEKGRERYTNITINGKPAKKGMEEMSGSWSTGEFATVLQDLFHESTAAEFRLLRTASIAGRDATVFDFEVDQANSHWRVQVPGQVFMPAYKGSVWIDKETSKVLRVEMQARKVPKAFPLDTVESAVEFGFVRIGDQQFLLPTHAEILSCVRGTSDCSRNVIDFRNYHKYSGESTITFSDSDIIYK